MRLKLYSGEDIEERENLLRWLFELGTDKIQLIIDEMLVTIHSERSRREELSELGRKLSVDERQLSRYLSVVREVVLRIILGVGGSEIQQDLIENGFSEQGVKFLFAKISELPQPQKDAIGYWGMESETHDDRNHFHGMGIKVDIRTLVDNGVLLGILPISDIDFRIFDKDREGDQRVRLELSLEELIALIGFLEKARQGAGKMTGELKKKWGQMVVAPATM